LGMSKCLDCQPGYYSKAKEMGNCTACPIGRAQTKMKTIACNDCVEGKYAPVTGMPRCIDCDPGYYNTEQAKNSNCTSCQPGLYSAEKGSIFCTECADGKYVVHEGSNLCSECPQGYMGAEATSERESCVICHCATCDKTEGMFQDELGQTSCKSCPQGYFSTNKTAAPPSCAKCTPGLYANETGLGKCKNCQEGKFTDVNATKVCKDCPAGYEAFKPLTTTTGGAAAGTGNAHCRACVIGHYQTQNGSVVPCKSCAKNYYAQNPGSPTCVACPEGWRAGVGAYQCTPDCG
jgi:hypothetical protein